MTDQIVKRCKYSRCNKKFKTPVYKPDQDYCCISCVHLDRGDQRNLGSIDGKKVHFKARGVREDGLHPNERKPIPKQSFAVETQGS